MDPCPNSGLLGGAPPAQLAAASSPATMTRAGFPATVAAGAGPDTDDITALWVPSIGLLAAGDSIYNGVHQYVLETPNGGFDAWLAAIHKIQSLHPRAVLAGHKTAGADVGPGILWEAP